MVTVLCMLDSPNAMAEIVSLSCSDDDATRNWFSRFGLGSLEEYFSSATHGLQSNCAVFVMSVVSSQAREKYTVSCSVLQCFFNIFCHI